MVFKYNKKELLSIPIEHISLEKFNPVTLIDSMEKMAFQARNLYRGAKIYEKMLKDKDCGIILCLAGSLISAGLKQIIVEMIEKNMIDVIVATGANIVDQDFFEALGFRHYIGFAEADDSQLQKLHIDRIYDTFIDEDELRICDETVAKIADTLEPRPYSSREFINYMGKYLDREGKNKNSIVYKCYEKDVPVFCPAFSDSSAGFGLVHHQWQALKNKKSMVTLDSAKDFLELTELKIKLKDTGVFMIGGGVPKNFTQDIVVAADILGFDAPMHKYAIQITVADVRDGALSSSTLKEAHSWGKVDEGNEQMIFGEATVIMPLLVGYGYHKKAFKDRKEKKLNKELKNNHK